MEAVQILKTKRRPSLNFEEMGIPVGSELIMTYKDKEYKAEVSGPKKVKYDGEEVSLSPLTVKILGHDNYYVQPTPYWYYNGKLLNEIYNETYTFEE